MVNNAKELSLDHLGGRLTYIQVCHAGSVPFVFVTALGKIELNISLGDAERRDASLTRGVLYHRRPGALWNDISLQFVSTEWESCI